MLSRQELQTLAAEFNVSAAKIYAICKVESGGKGFAPDGKILIQFEPAWFKKKAPYAPSGKWSVNKVDVQSKEWEAFNDAFSKNANAAMESTSVGMMQIMGFHWKNLGFSSVGEMWDFAKKSEINQVRIALRFIKKNTPLNKALIAGDWAKVAYYYNGSNYAVNQYDKKLKQAYESYNSTNI